MVNERSSDATLVAAWRQEVDKDRVFEILFERYRQDLLLKFQTMRFDAATCEDLVQETFKKMVSKLHTWKEDGPLKSWILTVGRNEALHFIRDNKTQRRSAETTSLHSTGALDTQGGEAGAELEDADTARPDRAAAARLQLQAVLQTLARAPDSDRQIFQLQVVEDLSAAQVAAIVGKPQGTIKSTVFRVRKWLKSELNPSESDPSKKEGSS